MHLESMCFASKGCLAFCSSEKNGFVKDFMHCKYFHHKNYNNSLWITWNPVIYKYVILVDIVYCAKYFGFVFSRSNKKRENYISFAQFVYFLRKLCLLFDFWMIKFTIMSKKHNCEFIIQKLKSKHTSLKKYTNWAKLIYFSLILREREEKKPKYFAPKSLLTKSGRKCPARFFVWTEGRVTITISAISICKHLSFLFVTSPISLNSMTSDSLPFRVE